MTTYSTYTDGELSTLIKNGDEAFFGVVFKQYYTALCYFAGRHYLSRAEAEDIVEEVFEKLWKGNLELRNASHLRSYLYKATRNACIDHLRKKDHAMERQMSFVAQLEATEPDYVHSMIRAEVLREIYLEIQNLPEQCSRIVALSYIEGFKNEEIAEKLGLSVQTVKNQKSLGIKLLKGKLSKELFMVFVVVFGMR